MQQNHAFIACVIDRSGSMSSIRADAIGGFNTFLEEQKKQPGTALFSLVLFDHEYLLVHDGVPLADVPPLTGDTYMPRGTTALLDAIGRTIDSVDARILSLPDETRPSSVIVAILTDGMENASSDYTLDRVRAMVTEHEQRGWSFVFLAANQDAISVATTYGMDPAHAMSFDATPEGTRSGSRLYSERVSYLRRRADEGSGTFVPKNPES